MHPILAVPLIALIDAVVMAVTVAVLTVVQANAILEPMDAAIAFFTYGGMAALAAGCVVAIPAWYFGRSVPRPQSLAFTAIGIAAGLGVAALLSGTFNAQFAVMMGVVGGLSGFLWWLLVERGRREDSLV